MRILFKYLPTAYTDGEHDLKAREKVGPRSGSGGLRDSGFGGALGVLDRSVRPWPGAGARGVLPKTEAHMCLHFT